MLILSRKKGQQILIDKGRIQMTVLKIKDGKASIGITAPKNVDVLREEVYLRNQQLEVK